MVASAVLKLLFEVLIYFQLSKQPLSLQQYLTIRNKSKHIKISLMILYKWGNTGYSVLWYFKICWEYRRTHAMITLNSHPNFMAQHFVSI